MSWTPALTQLRNVLAELYSDGDSARRVVADAGLNPQRIAYSPSAVNNWQAILTEADRQDAIDAILDVATQEYPTNKALASARASYRGDAAPNQGAPSATPSGGAPAAKTAIKILFLGANPSDTTRLRLDEEVRGIDQALAYGRNVSTAFKLGCVQIDLESLDEQDTPHLLAQRADPAQVLFA